MLIAQLLLLLLVVVFAFAMFEGIGTNRPAYVWTLRKAVGGLAFLLITVALGYFSHG